MVINNNFIKILRINLFKKSDEKVISLELLDAKNSIIVLLKL